MLTKELVERLDAATKRMLLAAAALARAEDKLLELATEMAQVPADPLCDIRNEAAVAATFAINDLAKKVTAAESSRKDYEEAQACLSAH